MEGPTASVVPEVPAGVVIDDLPEQSFRGRGLTEIEILNSDVATAFGYEDWDSYLYGLKMLGPDILKRLPAE